MYIYNKSFIDQAGQKNTTSCNIHKCCLKNFTIFKLEPTTPNMSQQVAKRVPHAAPSNVAIWYTEMLQSPGRGLRRHSI